MTENGVSIWFISNENSRILLEEFILSMKRLKLKSFIILVLVFEGRSEVDFGSFYDPFFMFSLFMLKVLNRIYIF
jgi:hypothetical protein